MSGYHLEYTKANMFLQYVENERERLEPTTKQDIIEVMKGYYE